jgi:hypothetical protein
MNFEQRLERAIARGQRTCDAKGREAAERAMTDAQFRNLHSQCRLELSEHIEQCLKKLVDRFPGFEFQTIVSDTGWGAKVSRDDIGLAGGYHAQNFYSRVEMVIRPFSDAHIVELSAKATIRNKELFHRTHYQMLSEADVDSFCELIDLWILEFVEQFCVQGASK